MAASGQAIYGFNTGLGANLGTSISEVGAFQSQLLEGRAGAVGDELPVEIVRATMFARAAMLSAGGSGISPHVFGALVAALNAGVHPVMPSLGSIGASDLVVMTALGRVLSGRGDADFGVKGCPPPRPWRKAGLSPVGLAPKDGLSLISASAVSVGHGALVVTDALDAYRQQQQAGALTMEGFGANRTILDPRLQAARPAFGQEQAASELRALLAGDALPKAATLQDPLSVRCMASIHGALAFAIEQARQAIEIELNAAGDNPLVLGDDGEVMSSGNFHTAALSLAFETLGLAVAQAAAASAARFVQLTGSGRNGLPRYLSPVGGASAGFVPLQKTVSAILAAIRREGQSRDVGFPAGVRRRRGPRHPDAAGDRQMRRHDFPVAAPDRVRTDGCRPGGRSARWRSTGSGNGESPFCRAHAGLGAAIRTGRSGSMPKRSMPACPAGSGRRSGLRPSLASSAGSSILQRSCTRGQRVWKRQPEGGFDGLGISPDSTSFVRRCSGSITGLADRSAPYRDASARGTRARRAFFHHLAEIHDDDPVGDAADHVEVVADDQDAERKSLLEVGKQVEQFALHGDVEPGRRFVGDQERRFRHQRARNGHAARLAAADLMREFVKLRFRQDRAGP